MRGCVPSTSWLRCIDAFTPFCGGNYVSFLSAAAAAAAETVGRRYFDQIVGQAGGRQSSTTPPID